MITYTIDVAGLEGRRVHLTSNQLDDLDSRVAGPLLRAGDEGWDDAVQVWNGLVARFPALVLQPTSAHDVVAAVGFAREHGLLLSVKGGGHHIAGTSIAEGGLTLDLSQMRDVTVEPDAKLARVGPGCRLKDVDRATQAYGLATVLGFISEVGVAGLTLGGALNEHDADDGAVGNRDARYALGAIGIWKPDEPKADTFPQWVRDAWQLFRSFSTGGGYVNFQTADEDEARIRAAYGANFDRLVEVKKTYDPHNLFRVNRNIPPA